MWPSRKIPEVELTTEAYGWWLRAQRPPLIWFLGQSKADQENMAEMGQEYTEDICVALGYAIANPRAAEAGLDGDTNPEAEEQLVRQLVTGFAEAIQGREVAPQSMPEPEPLSMGGVGKRRQESAQAVQDEKVKETQAKRLFGRAPDPVQEVAE